METATFSASIGQDDPSWDRAFEIAEAQLNISSNASHLLRTGWRGQIDEKEFIRVLGFSRMNIGAILEAAEIKREDAQEGENDAVLVERALRYLGLRYCTIVLGINFTTQRIFEAEPPRLWRGILREMMTNIEIGYRLGARVSIIGIECGMLMGFVKGAGLGLLMAHDKKAFQKWHQLSQGYEGRKLVMQIFGCEPYQVAAAALQLLGYGPEMAIGAAIGVGNIETRLIQASPEIMTCKAAYLWIEALREGRSYPARLDMREFFTELRPPREKNVKNTMLEVLYTEIATVKRRGSAWKWHLTGVETGSFEIDEETPLFQAAGKF